ncbi:histone deacetylase superfamily protein [Tribonema minus]|uniref:Histone deacetylase superfamily protein n=1 Tax=Tribonema minus TaxID=303371 RepID=A0A835ZG29_9STRA|nr:histone deacetylase superfamily protein [Tribonema minus]
MEVVDDAGIHGSGVGSGGGGEALGQAVGDGLVTLLVNHSSYKKHNVHGAREGPARYSAVEGALRAVYPLLPMHDAPEICDDHLANFHERKLINSVSNACTRAKTGKRNKVINDDTTVTPRSREAIIRAAGAVSHATREVVCGRAANAFCCVRPPGHHATPEQSMGFCFFNNVGVAAVLAHEELGMARVAVVDFDVHHGNGTQQGLETRRYAFFASTHQFGERFYPCTGAENEHGKFNNVLFVTFKSGAGSKEFRAAYTERVLPALEQFKPSIIFISAGFDAHKDDLLGEMQLTEDDCYWVTKKICEVAARVCEGRVVSALEGGYNCQALGPCAVAHVHALVEAANERKAAAAAAASASAAAAAAASAAAAAAAAAATDVVMG